MARFEQRISDDDVTAARKNIAAGATLRSAAAEIPCAPSTLSVRIKKAEAAEGGPRDRAAIAEQEVPAAGRAEYIRALQRIALGHDPTASARDKLTALKELLRLEPAVSQKAPVGAIFHVYSDGRVADDKGDVISRGDGGEDVSEP